MRRQGAEGIRDGLLTVRVGGGEAGVGMMGSTTWRERHPRCSGKCDGTQDALMGEIIREADLGVRRGHPQIPNPPLVNVVGRRVAAPPESSKSRSSRRCLSSLNLRWIDGVGAMRRIHLLHGHCHVHADFGGRKL